MENRVKFVSFLCLCVFICLSVSLFSGKLFQYETYFDVKMCKNLNYEIQKKIKYNSNEEKGTCNVSRISNYYKDRSYFVRHQCERYRDEIQTQSIKHWRLRWAIDRKLIWCPVFKAASSSWSVNFLYLQNFTDLDIFKQGINIHKMIKELYPPPGDEQKTLYELETSLKFLIVRDPFERVVSAYKNKLLVSTLPNYLKKQRYIVKNYRKNTSLPTDNNGKPTFEEYVDFLIDNIEKNVTNATVKWLDAHWIPITTRCFPCALDYDLIVKFETLNKDSNYLIQNCHLHDKIHLVWCNDSESQKEDISLYFKRLAREKVLRLYEYYKYDFILFGYDFDQYL